jgi:hypothetical protein
MGEYFCYRMGRFVTYTPWRRPDYQRLRGLLEAVRNETDIMSRYGLHLLGGVLFDFAATWDVDMCLTGPFTSPVRLEDDIDTINDLAFNRFELLLDLQWMEAPPPEVGYKEVLTPGFFHHHLRFIKTTCTVFHHGRDIRVTDLRDPELFRTEEITQLTEYLIEGRHSAYPGPSGKFIDRILANPHRKLKTSYDAETFLREDEDHFLRNTNR